MLILIIGAKGSGKTLLLTFLAVKEKRKKVYSNFHINVKHFRYLELDDLLLLNPNIIVFIDEIYTWLESRSSMSALNRYISYIVFQTRKRDIDVFGTAQMLSSVDVRIRNQADIIIIAKKRLSEFSNFEYYLYDRTTDKVIAFELKYNDAIKYFPYFDTKQIIEPNHKQDLEFKILEQNPEKMLVKVKEIIKEVKFPAITHESIKKTLFFNEYHLGYEKYIYLYLKGMINIDNNKVK